ncbi:MAG: HAD family phosphatase [Defluviitaleaceae bacterium]|nr:HAD family phosphatase [Defluviitaleaceae bacterium]
MIKNVIFDLGRVMYTYWPRADLEARGFGKEKIEIIMECLFDNPLWLEFDRGTYTVADGVEKACEMFPQYADDIRSAIDSEWLYRVVQIMPESLAFYNELVNDGKNIYILTNFGEDTFARIRERDSFFDDAKGIVVSAHEKLIKPDPAIYHVILSRYGLIPEETLFIDDSVANIDAARALGIHGIVFTDINDCRAQWEKLYKREDYQS